jgi:hypothetical protein
VSEGGGRIGEAPSGPLDDRIVRTLSEQPGHVAFNGLRRALAAHPESLTRSLRRLERGGTIGRDDHGYFLRDRIEPLGLSRRSLRSHPLASVRLPYPIPPDAVLGLLAGRWFGAVRWVGTYDARRPPALVWSVLGLPGQLVLQVKRGDLRLRAEGEDLRAIPPALAQAGEELLWNVLGRLRAVAPDALEGPVSAPQGTVAYAAAPEPRSGWAG